jgi:hypothetical protein
MDFGNFHQGRYDVVRARVIPAVVRVVVVSAVNSSTQNKIHTQIHYTRMFNTQIVTSAYINYYSRRLSSREKRRKYAR